MALRRYPWIVLFLLVLLPSSTFFTVADDNSKFPLEVEFIVPDRCLFGGFFVEVVLGLMLPLQKRLDQTLQMGQCSTAFLDMLEPEERRFVTKLQRSSRMKSQLRRMTAESEGGSPNNYVAIHHGDPCRINQYTADSRPRYLIARTMTEGFLHLDHVTCCNKADLVLVPSMWHYDLFKDKGVDESRLRLLPEAVNVEYFDPRKVRRQEECAASVADIKDEGSSTFVFLSIFAFGHRKGWDVLLDAYFAEFEPTDDVVLVLRAFKREHVKATHKKDDSGAIWYGLKDNDDIANMKENIAEFVEDYAFATTGKRMDQLPRVVWISETLSRSQLRALYDASSAFVLPTRGEGWLLPAVEAMSMELPVIVTNSSGPTAYMTDANSYPLRSDGLEEGTGFATPSRQHLQSLMRHAVAEPAEGHAKGRQARRDLESAFTPAHVSMLLMNHLKDLVSGG